jgi:hypothetical protein
LKNALLAYYVVVENSKVVGLAPGLLFKANSFFNIHPMWSVPIWCGVSFGVARWFIFKPKIPIWENFGGS